MALNLNSLKDFFNSYNKVSKFIVGFSGGLDSTTLLHVMHAFELPVHAVHINHNLFKDSDIWEQHCKEFCKQQGINLSVEHLTIDKVTKKSIEELARNARYQSLFQFVGEQDALVTAHHKNDLAETLILQLMRGSGPPGLAAMQKDSTTKYGRQLRPLLDCSRDDILEYADNNSLKWIEDPTNQNTDFNRNYVRMEILPRLMERWPATLQTLSRVVELQANTLQCLRDLANVDLSKAKTDDSHVLNIGVLQTIHEVRLLNALRGWISNHAMRAPSKKLLEQIAKDIVYKQSTDTSPVQTWEDGEIRRYRDRLYLMKPLPEHDPSQVLKWNINQPLLIESLGLSLSRSDLKQNSVSIPPGTDMLTIRFRQGGERLKPFGKKHHRSLKNLFQEADLPPWQRDRIPLIYYQDELISVLGYWNASVNCETPNCA